LKDKRVSIISKTKNKLPWKFLKIEARKYLIIKKKIFE